MALGRKSGHTTSSAPSIHVIAHDRMADRREMNADLVSPSGMEMGTKKVPRIEPSKACDVGLGRPTLIDDCHALPVSWIAGYRLVDCEGVGREVTPDHDGIAPDHPASGNRATQYPMRSIGFGDDQEARSLLVEPVNHASPLRIALLRQVAAASHQRVDQRTAPVARRWMDHHSGGLIDHEQRFILVDDGDRYGLAGDDPLFNLGDLDPDQLSFLGPVTRLLAAAIDQDVSLRDEGCRLRPRKLSALGNKEIEADIAVRLDGKLPDFTQRLTLRRIIRYGCACHDRGRGPLLAPQYPGQQERSHANRHVSDVERRPTQISNPDVDEIDDSCRGAEAIDEVSDRSAAYESQSDGAEEIPLPRRLVETAEDNQRARRKGHENPARVDPEIEPKRRPGIVDQRQTQMVADDLVRNVLRRESSRGNQLRDQIDRND